MTLVNNFCCGCKKDPHREYKKNMNPRSISRKRAGPPIRGRGREPFECKEPCNKLGFFSAQDWAFDTAFRNLPESNTACRCPNAVRMDQPIILQGRSCQCLIRPPKNGCGQRPDGCGCNNKLPKTDKPTLTLRCCKIKEKRKKVQYLSPKDFRIIGKKCLCH